MSGYTGWSDEKLSREQDRIEKIATVPGSLKDAERSRTLRNIAREFERRSRMDDRLYGRR